jgi:hypothetical protein
MFNNQLKVSGVTVKLRPYSEKRLKQLNEINEDISKWVNEHLDATISEVPVDLKAKWWGAKADVLWEGEYPEGFFASDEFESSLLKESEDFFVMKRLYL